MEHHRLLSLWKEVVAMKRLHAEMQTSTQRDMSRMGSEILSTVRDVGTAIRGTASNLLQSSRTGVCDFWYFPELLEELHTFPLTHILPMNYSKKYCEIYWALTMPYKQ